MTDINYALGLDGGQDDLPRTLRREKEARERELRERAAAASSEAVHPVAGLSSALAPDFGANVPAHLAAGEPPVAATVTGLEIPFVRLMTFFLKAVFAAIPALILLTAVLWGAGHLLRLYFPELVKMQILIYFPN